MLDPTSGRDKLFLVSDALFLFPANTCLQSAQTFMLCCFSLLCPLQPPGDFHRLFPAQGFPFYVLHARLREGLKGRKICQNLFCEKKRPADILAPDIFRPSFCLSPMLACLDTCKDSLASVAIFIHLSVKAILLSLYLLSSSSSSSCLLISLSIISTSVCVPYLIHVCAPHSSLPLPLLPIHPVLDLDV